MSEFSWSLRAATAWSEVWEEKFIQDWNLLYHRPSPLAPRSPFNHPEIVRACVLSGSAYLDHRPLFVRGMSNSGHDVFLPLVYRNPHWKRGSVRQLKSVGEHLLDYNDPILTGPKLETTEMIALIEAFWRALADEFLAGKNVAFDNLEIACVRGKFMCHQQEWRQSELAPYVDLSTYTTFDAYWHSRSSKMRTEIERNIRRLTAIGRLEFCQYSGERIEEAVKWIPRLEAARRKKYPGSLLPHGYLERIARANSGAPTHFSAMLLDGCDISWHAGFYIDGIFYWYLPMYDADFAKYSPGQVHLYHAIAHVIDQGGVGVDFLRGTEAYKRRWTDGCESTLYGLTGKATTVASCVRQSCSRLLNSLQYLRNALSRPV